jgi:hypothetical protein
MCYEKDMCKFEKKFKLKVRCHVDLVDCEDEYDYCRPRCYDKREEYEDCYEKDYDL